MFKYTLESTEEFKSSDENVTKLTETCKRLTREEFKKSILPGDIVITYPKSDRIILLVKKLSSLITQWAQNSSFSSSKIVGKDAKEIIGYDTKISVELKIDTCAIDEFLNKHEIVLLLRHKAITDKARKIIVDYMYQKKEENVEYAYGKVFLSWFKHLFVKEPELKLVKDPAQLKLFQKKKEEEQTLFCSSIIKYAYKKAGCNIKIKDVDDSYVWPKDILLSPSMKVIGGYFAKSSGIK